MTTSSEALRTGKDLYEPMKLGTILFTLVEPHEGHEVAYNRWYERDHIYSGCLVGEYNFAGQRFVARRQEKERRYPADSPITPDAMTGSFLALYWILKGHFEDWNRWALKQLKWLHANDRMFAERDHVHTLMYRHEWAHYRDEDPVPASLALDHRFGGLVAMIGEVRADDGQEAFAEAWRGDVLPDLLDGSPVANCLAFSAIPLEVDAPGVQKSSDVGRRFLHLYFCDTDPHEAWDDVFAGLGEAVAGTGLADTLWVSPFIPTVPGTDRYTDELR